MHSPRDPAPDLIIGDSESTGEQIYPDFIIEDKLDFKVFKTDAADSNSETQEEKIELNNEYISERVSTAQAFLYFSQLEEAGGFKFKAPKLSP